jgi:(p)ppGpp synthase/HD superfamily hydrolase
MSLIKKAAMFADEKHAGQKRKFSGEPYIVHPLAVADLVEAAGASEAVIAAALLHDVIEDCGSSPEEMEKELEAEFGSEITGLVVEVSNRFRSASGRPRAERKANEAARLATVSANAQTIKVADIINNASNVAERSPEFAALYLPEAVALLAVLVRAAPSLLEKAAKIVAAKP